MAGLDWREIVAADVASLPVAAENRLDSRVVATNMRLPVYRMAALAARRRRISLAAYARRAVMAMVCHDLGIPLSEALAHDPRMSRETGYAVLDPDGTAFGPWEIASLAPTAEGAGDE